MENNILLNIQNITKSYGKHHVLNGVSFDILNNQTIAFVGVNGSGKSTLMEIICGLKKYDCGNLNGIETSCYNIGYMPQTFSLFNDLTVKENLQYLATLYNLSTERINYIIKLCYLESRQNYLCKNLSGGYKQLVSLASAILHNPKLLILDEPTSAMDPLFRESFWKVINEYKKNGGSVLISTHYMEEILMCDTLVVLSKGVICFNDGVHETFSNGKYKSASELILALTKGDEYAN